MQLQPGEEHGNNKNRVMEGGTPTAKDLGVCQRRRGTANRVAEVRTKPLGEVCRRIGYLPLERQGRSKMAAALVGGAGLYGAEVDKPTPNMFQALRVAMSRAAGRGG